MFDTTNKFKIMQANYSNESGYQTNAISRHKGTFSNRKTSIGINQKQDADKERSSKIGKRIYWGVSSLGISRTIPFSDVSVDRWSSIQLYRSANGDRINSAISRLDELYGGEEKMFEVPQIHMPISIQEEADIILTELAKIESKFGKKPFVDAYESSQHTFEESDEEWEAYLREERKRQAILDEI